MRSGVGARARSNIEWGVRGDRGDDFTGKIRPNSKRSEWIERGQNALLGGSPGADSKHPNETERGPLEKKMLRTETATKQATKQANETERGPLDFFRIFMES